MKKLTIIIILTTFTMVSVFAQNSNDEQEILKIHKSLDQAFVQKDMAVFERILADDYVYADPLGRMKNRAENLEELRKEFAQTNYKIVSSGSDNVKVKVSGNMAVVTGDWSFVSTPNGFPNAEPHKDTGRYTGVYEKRDGKWMLIAEHFSEAPHDRKLMEQQVLKAGQEYALMIKNQDGAAVEKLLTDEYIFTNERGEVKNKAQDLATYKDSTVKFELFEISDQKVRVVGNGAAIETGTIRYKGTGRDGKPMDGSERYTTVWVWRGGRWQIASDHVSEIKQK